MSEPTTWDKLEARIAEPDLAEATREEVLEALHAGGESSWAATEIGRPLTADDMARVGHHRWG